MIKAYLVFVLLLISNSVQSQHSKEIDAHLNHTVKEVQVDIDDTVFSKVSDNTYMSGEPKILFLSAFVVDSFQNQKVKMLKFFTEKKFTIKLEKEISGKKVFFIEGPINKDDTDFVNRNYCIKYDEESVIMITTLVEATEDDNYKVMLEKVVQSVIDKN
jgi:hypothetical protein